jgi:Cytochrome P460
MPPSSSPSLPPSLCAVALLTALAGCGAGSATTPATSPPAAALEFGADYRSSYRKVTAEPFLSTAHSGIWVDVYVNELGADAYAQGKPVPVGTIIVKEGWQDDGGRPSTRPAPLFVMRREPDGTTPPERAGWTYAMWAQKPEGTVYLRGDDAGLERCWSECHGSYPQGLGGLTPSSIVPR